MAVLKAPNSLEVVVVQERRLKDSDPLLQPVKLDQLPTGSVKGQKNADNLLKGNTEEKIFVSNKKPKKDNAKIAQNEFIDFEKEVQQSKQTRKEQARKTRKDVVGGTTSNAVSSRASKGAIREAKPLSHVNLAPEYPQRARKKGWEGLVVLQVQVQKDGRPSEVMLKQSSGYTILDDAAITAVRKWKFSPAESNAIKYVSKINLPVEFRLID